MNWFLRAWEEWAVVNGKHAIVPNPTDLVDCENCSHRGIDGGPSPVMVCNHPDNKTCEQAYIISWRDDKRTAPRDKCPAVRDEVGR
jgi:hypothetical protein